jgi:hypothetical protein
VGSARGDVVFRKEGEEIGHAQGEVADLLRELGGLLLLAQQRNREGRVEVKPGSRDDAWWTRKERWGGQAGGKMPHEEADWVVEDFPKVVVDKDVIVRTTSNGHTRAKRSLDISIVRDVDAIMEDAARAPNVKAKSLTDVDVNSQMSVTHAVTSSPNAKITPITTQIEPDPKLNDSYKTPIPTTSPRSTSSTANGRPNRPPMSSRRVKILAESWKILRAPSPLWDPNMMYEAIGRPESNGEWDYVYMLSSINTHVCLLKMTVSRAYLDWLESGSAAKGEQAKERPVGRSGISLPVKEERDWEGELLRGEILYVERSAWWNLFVPGERVEALRALWRVLSWLSREVGSGGGKVFGNVE